MKLGAEPKKVAALGGLMVVLIAVWLFNSSQAPETGPSSAPPVAPPAVGGIPTGTGRRDLPGNTATAGGVQKRVGSRQQLRSNVQDFKPKLFDKDNPVDPTKVDPTLSTGVMAKLQAVTLSGGGRSLFDFGPVARAVEVPKGPIIKVPAKPKYPIYGPAKPEEKPVVAEVKPPPPPPPPIPLKFYGFVLSKRDGGRRAFFMEGEEIHIASEGETMKKRYKLVRIGVNSALVEDLNHKHQQSLPLVEEQQGSND